MSKSKSTKTVRELTNAEAISLARQWEAPAVSNNPLVAVERVRDLADRLEAAEAELTRRDEFVGCQPHARSCSVWFDNTETACDCWKHSYTQLAASRTEPQCMTTHGTHAESCGELKHYHGKNCSHECPTCGGFPLWDTNHPPESGKA